MSACGPNCDLRRIWNAPPLPLPAYISDEHVERSNEDVQKLTNRLYTPLLAQQFRVLKILPGTVESALRCRLLRATLTPVDGARLDEEIEQDGLVEYDALSYSWGRPAWTCSCYCNDIHVPITLHLKNALHNLRSPDEARYVWTDAFCINQFDLTEKGEQVQLIFTIFGKARSVIGWLGSPYEHSEVEHLLAWLAWASEHDIYKNRENFAIHPHHHVSGASITTKIAPLIHYSREFDATCSCIFADLRRLVFSFVENHSWFSRTWIRQEVLTAKRVEMRYGPYHFDLQVLTDLVELADKAGQNLRLERFRIMVGGRNFRFQKPVAADEEFRYRVPVWLNLVLSNAQGFEATLPQDRIFALQNMAQPGDARSHLLFPTINYGLSSNDVYENFTKQLMFQHNTTVPLDVFEDRRDFQSNGLPSWVLDLRSTKTRFAKTEPLNFNSHRPYSLDIDSPGMLVMGGVLLGTVGTAWPPHRYQDFLTECMGRLSIPSFVLSGYTAYRAPSSRLPTCSPWQDLSMAYHCLDEIAYGAFDYTLSNATKRDSYQQSHILVNKIARPGDLLVSFTQDLHNLTGLGIERTMFCSVVRESEPGSGKYLFLGPCVFDRLWRSYKADEVSDRLPEFRTWCLI